MIGMHRLQRAVYRRRLVSMKTMELKHMNDTLYHEFFAMFRVEIV